MPTVSASCSFCFALLITVNRNLIAAVAFAAAAAVCLSYGEECGFLLPFNQASGTVRYDDVHENKPKNSAQRSNQNQTKKGRNKLQIARIITTAQLYTTGHGSNEQSLHLLLIIVRLWL